MLFRIYSILSFILILSACSPSPYHKEAIKLNNQATQLFLTNKDSALILFNKAIALDSSYQIPIQNKANLLISQKKYSEALETVNLLISKKEYPEAWQMKGMLLDKIGKTEEALKAYERSIDLQQKRLEAATSDKQKSMENYGIGLTYLLMSDTIKGKELMNGHLEKSKNIQSSHDTLMQYAHDKNILIDRILHSEN